MQAVFPLYPSLSRLHLLHLYHSGVSYGSTRALLGGYSHPPAMPVESPWGPHARPGFLRRVLLGSYAIGYALIFGCSPGYWWRPSTCLPFFPSFFFSFFLRFSASPEGTFPVKAEGTCSFFPFPFPLEAEGNFSFLLCFFVEGRGDLLLLSFFFPSFGGRQRGPSLRYASRSVLPDSCAPQTLASMSCVALGGLAQGLGVGLLAAPTGLSPLCLGLES